MARAPRDLPRNVALPLQRVMAMSPEPGPPGDTPPDANVHRFTVQRGMAVALVIETPDWYGGLLQAALARIRIEGLN